MTGRRLTADEAVKQLNLIERGDNERAHGVADTILLDFIRDAGFPEVADAWQRAEERVEFWYA